MNARIIGVIVSILFAAQVQAASGGHPTYDIGSSLLHLPVVEVIVNGPFGSQSTYYEVTMRSSGSIFSVQSAQPTAEPTDSCTSEPSSTPTVPDNQAQTERLAGTWQFTYTIISTFSQTYMLDISTVDESSTTAGTYIIRGYDTTGSYDVIAMYSPTSDRFSLLDVGSSFNRFFSFDFTGDNTVSGCYYQVSSGSSDLGNCYSMNGIRSTTRSHMAPALSGMSSSEMDQLELAEDDALDSLSLQGVGRKNSGAQSDPSLFQELERELDIR